MIILLYVMDSLRPDFLSCQGYPKKTSPHIDQLAQEGVLFTNAFAQSTWTRTSGASLLTSTYPSVHGALTLSDSLPASIPTLPQELKRKGFETMALSSMGNISPFFGFGKGFDHFIELYKEKSVIERRRKIRFRGLGGERHFRTRGEEVPVVTSEDINTFLFPFLQENRGKDLFVFIWSIDTHDPYFHRDPSLAPFGHSSDEIVLADEVTKMRSEDDLQRLRTLYEDMIYYNDHHLGILIEKLKEMNLFDQTFFILTSDHGESFGEHGVNSHGGVPYDEVARIPLILKFPDRPFHDVCSGLAQHVDLIPTILETVSLGGEGMLIQGKSLWPYLREEGQVNESIFMESQLMRKLQRFSALRTLDHKYIEIRPGKFSLREWLKEGEKLWPLSWVIFKPGMLFHLEEDPLERRNIIREERDLARRFHLEMEATLRKNRAFSRVLGQEKTERKDTDEAVAKQLHAMGYFD